MSASGFPGDEMLLQLLREMRDGIRELDRRMTKLEGDFGHMGQDRVRCRSEHDKAYLEAHEEMIGLAADIKVIRTELAAAAQEAKIAQARDERGQKTTAQWFELAGKIVGALAVVFGALVTAWFAYNTSTQVEAMKSAVSALNK